MSDNIQPPNQPGDRTQGPAEACGSNGLKGPSASAPVPSVLKMFDNIATGLAALAFLIAIAGLVGNVFGISVFVSLAPGLRGMSPITAAGLMLIAATFIPNLIKRPRTTWISLGTGACLSILALSSQLMVRHDVASELIAIHWFGRLPGALPQTSLATALCMLILVTAQALRFMGRTRSCDLAATLSLAVSGIGVLGYAYGVDELYALFIFNTMALHTALALWFLSIATLLRDGARGYVAILFTRRAAGKFARRQLLMACLIPVAGWILARATALGTVSPIVAIAVLVTLTFLPLAILIVRNGHVLARLDEARDQQKVIDVQVREQLETLLAERLLELNSETHQRKVAEEAVSRTQRLEAVGQLTGGIAHDFNNLLMAIAGNLELLQRALPSDSKPWAYANRAKNATDKGVKLTSQLLAFSRTQRMTIVPVELEAAIESARTLIGNSLGPEIAISVAIPGRPIWANTDQNQLELALLNLALNARDAMPEGGLLTITFDEIHTAKKGAMAAITVSDTGTGMKPETLARAGEPFFTTKEHGKGTGLGLAQVYGFCLQCAGDLRITSKVGEGTSIEILLPMASPPVPVEFVPASELAPLAGEITSSPILVVDDDESVRTVLAEGLRLAGYTVFEAADGFSALRMLNDLKPALAVIDFLMPGMHGAELARKIRDREPGLPIIFVSGFSDTLALDSISDAVVIRKPLELNRLYEAVSQALADCTDANAR